MTKRPPPWFDAQAPEPALMKELPALMDRRKGGRATSFMLYLLIRSVLYDRGDPIGGNP
jgi:hypothetical protein